MPQGTGCCTSLLDAPSTCLALPSLPKVTALQDWARDLSSSHLHMYTLLLARLTQPMSSAQVISPPGRLVLHHLASPGLSCVVHLCTGHLQPSHTVCPLSFHVPWALLGSPSKGTVPAGLRRAASWLPSDSGARESERMDQKAAAHIPESWLGARHGTKGFTSITSLNPNSSLGRRQRL